MNQKQRDQEWDQERERIEQNPIKDHESFQKEISFFVQDIISRFDAYMALSKKRDELLRSKEILLLEETMELHMSLIKAALRKKTQIEKEFDFYFMGPKMDIRQ